jgi:dTDP-4-amino-4,6-dideoxygalactose transaminase
MCGIAGFIAGRAQGAPRQIDDIARSMSESLRHRGPAAGRWRRRCAQVQAAILIEKLKIFPDEIEARDRAARRYTEGLAGVAITPTVPAGSTSVWAQYTLRISGGRRDALAASLKAEGIPTAIYYPIPLHRQQAYKHYPIGGGGVAVSDRLATEVISLPMHAYLDVTAQDRIIDATRRALKA